MVLRVSVRVARNTVNTVRTANTEGMLSSTTKKGLVIRWSQLNLLTIFYKLRSEDLLLITRI